MIAAGPPHSGLILANCRAGQAMKTSPRPCARRRGSAPGYRLYLSLTTRQNFPYRGGSDGARPSLPDGDPSRLAVSGAAIGRWDKPTLTLQAFINQLLGVPVLVDGSGTPISESVREALIDAATEVIDRLSQI